MATISLATRRDRKSEERSREEEVAGVGESIGRADALRHVEADAFGIALRHESREVDAVLEDVVRAAGHDPPVGEPDSGLLDPRAAGPLWTW
jgi:hypothetical protein